MGGNIKYEMFIILTLAQKPRQASSVTDFPFPALTKQSFVVHNPRKLPKVSHFTLRRKYRYLENPHPDPARFSNRGKKFSTRVFETKKTPTELRITKIFMKNSIRNRNAWNYSNAIENFVNELHYL